MKEKILFISAFMLAAVCPVVVDAQDSVAVDRDEFEFQALLDPEAARIDGKKQSVGEGQILWDFGAIGRSTFINFQSTSNRKYVALWNHQLRYWGRAQFADNLEVYIRLKTSRIDYRSGDTITGDHHNRDDSKLGMGYIAYGHPRAGDNFRVTAGRFYAFAGQGLAMAKVLDGGQVNVYYDDFSFSGFSGRSVASDDHPNPAFPGMGDSRFNISGAQLDYRGFTRHQPYVGVVWVDDYSEKTNRTNQYFDQNMVMKYAGMRGQLRTDLRYSIEALWGSGRIGRFGAVRHHETVHSHAFTANLQYILPEELGVLQYDYKRGSGDSDRDSVTEIGTSASSQIGGSDKNFFYMGYTDTGLNYSPRLSNIQMHHVGWTYSIIDEVQNSQKYQFNLDYYAYRKDIKTSAVYDFTVDESDRNDLGSEIDFTTQYNIFTNVSVIQRTGWFMPGKAYFKSSPRIYYRFDLYVDF